MIEAVGRDAVKGMSHCQRGEQNPDRRSRAFWREEAGLPSVGHEGPHLLLAKLRPIDDHRRSAPRELLCACREQ